MAEQRGSNEGTTREQYLTQVELSRQYNLEAIKAIVDAKGTDSNQLAKASGMGKVVVALEEAQQLVVQTAFPNTNMAKVRTTNARNILARAIGKSKVPAATSSVGLLEAAVKDTTKAESLLAAVVKSVKDASSSVVDANKSLVTAVESAKMVDKAIKEYYPKV